MGISLFTTYLMHIGIEWTKSKLAPERMPSLARKICHMISLTRAMSNNSTGCLYTFCPKTPGEFRHIVAKPSSCVPYHIRMRSLSLISLLDQLSVSVELVILYVHFWTGGTLFCWWDVNKSNQFLYFKHLKLIRMSSFFIRVCLLWGRSSP